MAEAKLANDVLADPLLQDDNKFFLLAGRTTPTVKSPTDEVESAASTAEIANAASASVGTAGMFASVGSDEVANSAHHCVLGSSFIIESTSALTTVATAAGGTVNPPGSDIGACKSEPVDTTGIDAWAAASAAAASSTNHIILQQQQQQLIHSQHHLIQHQLPAFGQASIDPTAKVLLLPNLTASTFAAAAAAAAAGNYTQSHAHVSSSPAGQQETSKRCRTNLTEEQKLELERTFAKSKYPDYPIVDELSRRISLPYKKVLVWFKNRRAKEKRTRRAEYIDQCGIGAADSVTGGRGGGDFVVPHHATPGAAAVAAAFGTYPGGPQSSSASTISAAAPTFNAGQQYPFAIAQYPGIRQCLSVPVDSLQQQQQQQQQQKQNSNCGSTSSSNAATPSTNWMEREAGVLKFEPGLYHRPAIQQPLPFSLRQQTQQHQHYQLHPMGQQFVFVSAASIATQTSPMMLEFEDAVAAADKNADDSGIVQGDASLLMKSAAPQELEDTQTALESVEHHKLHQQQQMEHQPSSEFPFDVTCQLSSVASATADTVSFDTGAVSEVFLDDTDARIS